MPTKIYDVMQPPTFEALHQEATNKKLGETGVRLLVVERMVSELDQRRRMGQVEVGQEELFLRPSFFDFISEAMIGRIERQTDSERIDIGAARIMRRSTEEPLSDEDGELMLVTLEN